MTYEKQTFVNNSTVLKAEHLDHMEEGIYKNRSYIREINTAIENGEFNGEPGYTPVKGVDYFTEDDKTEIIDGVADELSFYVTPQMFGAKGDGVTDDTQAIQNALNASSYVYIPDGTYMIYAENNFNGGIKPQSNQTIILSENAVFKAIKSSIENYTIVNLNNVSNVHICGGKIQGEKADSSVVSEFGYGIFVNGGQHITIEKMEIWDCRGDCILIGYSSRPSKHVTVRDCVLHDCHRQGISVVGGDFITIRDCEIYNISGTDPQYGIDIEPDGARYAKNIVIDSCYIHDNAIGSICVAGVTNVLENVTITNCKLNSVNFQGTIIDGVVTGGKNIKVSNCNIKTAYFYTPNEVSVSDCTLGSIYLGGGKAIISDCDVVSSSYAIVSSRDAFPTNKSELICYNCRLVTTDAAQYFIRADSGDNTNEHPSKLIKFVNCSIAMGANCQFSTIFASNELCFDGCKVVFNKAPTFLFISGGNSACKFVVKNTKMECADIPSYFMYVGVGYELDLEISNSKLIKATTFIYSETSLNGKIKLFNNDMGSTNIQGTDKFEKAIQNTLLTLETLPRYDGGVS